MCNIGSIRSSHDWATLHPATTSYGCNCRVKNSCPLNGKCLTPKLVYRADVENNSNNEKKYNLGLADTTFKKSELISKCRHLNKVLLKSVKKHS